MLGVVEKDLRAAYAITSKQERYAAVDAAKAKVIGALPAGGRRDCEVHEAGARRGLPRSPGQGRALEHPRQRHAHRRPRRQDGPPDRRGGRLPAAHARLGAVHARRDAGALRRHARHRRRRAVRRLAGGHLQGALHAPLQLPALLGRRDRPHGLARPPRDRPRQARLARHPPDAAAAARVPLHDPRRLRDHRIERLLLDGDGLRLLARPDGRRRAPCARRSPASPWASSRKASASRCSPTSSATRITSATWTSRSRAPRTA